MNTLRWVILLLSATSVSMAASRDWSRLSDLRPGDRIRVQTTDGIQTGDFQAVTAESLTVGNGASQARIERPKIRRVVVLSKSKRLRNALVGAAIGFAVGLTLDKTLGTYFYNEAEYTSGDRALMFGAPIAVFGGIGAAIPSHPTLYEAP